MLKRALEFIETWLTKNRGWAEIKNAEPNVITVEYGVILSDGTVESAIGTRRFYESGESIAFTHN